VFYHLVHVILNLVASMFLTSCPNLSNFRTSSHVPWEMSHMASLVYYKIWDFSILFHIVPNFLQVHNVLLQMSKMSLPYFPFLSNTFCINHPKKSLFSSFSFFFLSYQFLNNSIIKTLNVCHVISVFLLNSMNYTFGKNIEYLLRTSKNHLVHNSCVKIPHVSEK
jgi:hypothetical protein